MRSSPFDLVIKTAAMPHTRALQKNSTKEPYNRAKEPSKTALYKEPYKRVLQKSLHKKSMRWYPVDLVTQGAVTPYTRPLQKRQPQEQKKPYKRALSDKRALQKSPM